MLERLESMMEENWRISRSGGSSVEVLDLSVLKVQYSLLKCEMRL